MEIAFKWRAQLVSALIRLHNFCVDRKQIKVEPIHDIPRDDKTPIFDKDGRLDKKDVRTRPKRYTRPLTRRKEREISPLPWSWGDGHMTRDQRAVNLRRKILEAGIKRPAPKSKKSVQTPFLFLTCSSRMSLHHHLCNNSVIKINKCRIDMSVFMIRMCVETECA